MPQFHKKEYALILSLLLVALSATPCYADGLSGIGEGYAIMAVMGVLQVLLLLVSIGYFFRRTESVALRQSASVIVFVLSLCSLLIGGVLFFPRAQFAPFIFLAPLISFALLFHRLADRASGGSSFSLLYGLRSLFFIVILYMFAWLALEQVLDHFFIISLLGQHLLYFALLVFMVLAYMRQCAAGKAALLTLRHTMLYSVLLSFAGFICCRLVLHFDYYVKHDGFVDFYGAYIFGMPFYFIGAVLLALSGIGAAYIANLSLKAKANT